MRDAKKLVQFVYDYIKRLNPKDGEPIGMYTDGLCSVAISLMNNNLISIEEYCFLLSFFKEEILKECYSSYPVTYQYANYGKQNSGFFFKKYNWSIRIQWLEEVISKL